MARRVLVIEDNPDGRMSLCFLLQLWGCEVETAADGEQGLEKGLTWKPDAVVSDIGLPQLDGFEIARRLRSALGAQVCLIALTAYSQPEVQERALRSGFDEFLNKPADPDELHRLLEPARAA